MKYSVITSTSFEDFLFKCQDSISKGWALQGGVSITSIPTQRISTSDWKDSTQYAQAFTFPDW